MKSVVEKEETKGNDMQNGQLFIHKLNIITNRRKTMQKINDNNNYNKRNRICMYACNNNKKPGRANAFEENFQTQRNLKFYKIKQ